MQRRGSIAGVTTGRALRYVALPELIPRLYRLIAQGFVHIPVFMAFLYQIVGLLPHDHAYLRAENAGRFGIRHVIAAAAMNLRFEWRRIDQIIVFTVILAGVVLLICQIMLLIASFVFMQSAFATASYGLPAISTNPVNILFSNSIYGHPGGNPSQDLAFIMLDKIFGVRNIFYSCMSTGVPCLDLEGRPINSTGIYPNAFHQGLHALLRFYSLGIFILSVFVIIYYVTTIAAETAQSGVPFGRRYNKVWVPIRLMLFAALLVPINIGGINAGLNAAQIIVLWTAKLGSNFATNAWGVFNLSLNQAYLGNASELIGRPNVPEVNGIAQFMFVAKACKIAEEYAYGGTDPGARKEFQPDGIQAYVVREMPSFAAIVPGPNARKLEDTDFDTAKKFSNYGPIRIRFGTLSDVNASFLANTRPQCGEVRVSVTDVDRQGIISGSTGIQEVYYELIRELWADRDITRHAACLRQNVDQNQHNPNCAYFPDKAFIERTVTRYQNFVTTNIDARIAQQINTAQDRLNVPASLRDKGWAGASIWYNRIAEMNGDVATAVFSVPRGVKYPMVMETVAAARRESNQSVSASTAFDPVLDRSGAEIRYTRERDYIIAMELNRAYNVWLTNDAGRTGDTAANQSDAFSSAINWLMGTDGMYSMRKNPNIHPLAQLSVLGRGMMEASIRNFTGGAALTLGSQLPGLFQNVGGEALKILGNLLSTFGTVTMAMSFVLYYVIPFMPFIYFTFAVSGWLRAVFEAVVGVPLWALAHLRIDGEGMPGPLAKSGYFLLLEIFLRPVLIVFGMIASIQIFSALVMVMNSIFDIVLANVGGFDSKVEMSGLLGSNIEFSRAGVDEFFYTAMYAILCYMLALGCFKLIDIIPASMMRWFGTPVSTVSEQGANAANQVVGQAYSSAAIVTQDLKGGALAAMVFRGK